MSQQNNIPASFYKNFSTETLESMLRDMTLSEQALDMDQLDAIMAELDHRTGAVETMPPEEAWKMFRNETEDSEPIYLECACEEIEKEMPEVESHAPHHRQTRIGLRAVLIAATLVVVIFGSMIVAQAGGVDVFGALARWTDETFGFGSTYYESTSEENDPFEWPVSNTPADAQFQTMQEALDAFGIDFEIAEPKWLPDGYKTSELVTYYDPTLPDAYFYVSYLNEGGSMIAVQFINYIDLPATIYEKTDAPVEEYTIGDITYYVFSNERTEKVAWITDHFECCVYGHVTREEVRAIAESIYR